MIPTANTLQKSNAKKKRRGDARSGRKNKHLAAGFEATFLRSQFISLRIRRAWVVT